MESIRQKVFFFLDNNKDIKNKDLYEKFQDENEGSLRNYKKQYLEKKAKTDKLKLLLESESDLVISTKLELMKRTGKKLFNEDITDLTRSEKPYYKIANKNKKPSRERFHIFPLLKSFKLLPLYIFKKVYELSKEIKQVDFSISQIYDSLIDVMNAGIYDIDEISTFSYKCEKGLKGFLDHVSWKINTIQKVNKWLGIELKPIVTNYKTGEFKLISEGGFIEEKALEEEYLKLKGKMLISFLPEFYGIYYYFKKREFIVNDFGKACFLNNFGDNTPVSITELVERYNNDLDYRERQDKYYIHFEYNESQEFLNGNNE